MYFITIHSLVLFTLHVFCRDDNIQPMGVDEEGKLVPMSGLGENLPGEETKSEPESDGDTEKGDKDWNV